MSGRLRGDDRGVSEILGFMLSFSVVVLSVGIVYTSGYAVLTDLQASEQLDSAERAMDALGGTFAELERGEGPARGSEVRLRGASMTVTEGTHLRVTVHRATGAATYDYPVDRLAYRWRGTDISYDAGAVVRDDPGPGSYLVRRPNFVCQDGVAVVSIVDLTTNGSASLSRSGSVLVESRVTARELDFPSGGASGSGPPTRVNVTVVGSPNADAWSQYFEDAEGWNGSENGSSFACTADEVYVRQTVTNLRFVY
jgi:hypothetical protein